jgi:hypothetical protein
MELLAQLFKLLLEREHRIRIALRGTANGLRDTFCLLLKRTTFVTQRHGDLTFVLARALTDK